MLNSEVSRQNGQMGKVFAWQDHHVEKEHLLDMHHLVCQMDVLVVPSNFDIQRDFTWAT